MIDEIRNMKKVELHLHLDGSVMLKRAEIFCDKREEILVEEMVAGDKCCDLSDYLTKFDLPISIMQSRENLRLVAMDLVDYLEKENVVYAEVRFAPMFHVNGGLSYDEVVEAVIEGLNSNKRVKTNLILCMMRGMDRESNIRTIEVADRYLGYGVCAIDLAGAEDKYSLNDYVELLEIAKSRGIPFTIHAGESRGYNEVLLAVEIGSKRIGHGIHAVDSESAMRLLKEKGVLLEICPTSNVQTNAVLEYRDSPIYKFYREGINVCINTDNVTVSNISISEEYLKLYDNFGFSVNDFKNMNKMAVRGSFLTEEEKSELLKFFE